MPFYDSSLMRVLRCFGSDDTLGFTELAESLQFETDLTGYYLRKLQRRGLVEKVDRGRYQITPLGKSMLAHSQQLSGLTITPRLSIMLVVSAGEKYAVTRRTVQPFIGKVEWPTGPLSAGEEVARAAERVLHDRLGLEGTPNFRGFFRRIDKLNDTVFDDKLFAVHLANVGSTEADNMATGNQIGEILLLTKSELTALPNRAKSLLDILDFVSSDQSYAEQTYPLQPSDLY